MTGDLWRSTRHYSNDPGWPVLRRSRRPGGRRVATGAWIIGFPEPWSAPLSMPASQPSEPLSDRDLLDRLRHGPVSGDVLARDSGQTRAAVWKRIQALRAAGVAIQAWPGRGYALAQPLELLDARMILAAVPAPLRADIAGLDVAWSIDSTNSELLRRPPAASGVQVLLAERQSAGRGRRGRSWESPLAANMYLSLARRFDAGLARLGGLGLVAGLAVAEALHACGLDQVRLKWPNDLVVPAPDGRLLKLGGLLVEGGGENAGPVRAVIGIGLNLRMPDQAASGIGQPWTDVHALAGDAAPGRNRLAGECVAALLPALDRFDRNGLAPFLERYALLDALRDRQVQIHGGDGVRTGTALGIAADGALRVHIEGAERLVHAGEVSVRPGAGAT